METTEAIQTVKVGISQYNVPAPSWLKNSATSIVFIALIMSVILTPMPTSWINADLKTYLLEVINGLAILFKSMELGTGLHQTDSSNPTN